MSMKKTEEWPQRLPMKHKSTLQMGNWVDFLSNNSLTGEIYTNLHDSVEL